MSAPHWIRLTPEHERDGTRYAWKLEITFDPDWQDFSLSNEHGAMTFAVHITDEMAVSIRQIETTA